MANLIITIIAIALTAILAIMGIYYGGDIYRSYLVNAKANEIMNYMHQTRAAMIQWSSDNGSTEPVQGAGCSAHANCNPDSSGRASGSCWTDALTTNRRYLSFTPIYICAPGWSTPMNYGPYGEAWSYPTRTMGTLNRSRVAAVDHDVSGSRRYISWLAGWFSTGASGYGSGSPRSLPSQAEAALFFSRVCHALNERLGLKAPYAGLGMTINSNTISGTDQTYGLPVDTDFAPDNGNPRLGIVDANLTKNVCFMNHNTSSTNGTIFQLYLPAD